MFDIGFSELLLVAVVALIVLGPERLPRAAKFAGLWVRRAKAQWYSVRSELERELADDELRRSLAATRDELASARQQLDEGGRAIRDGVVAAAGSAEPHGSRSAESADTPALPGSHELPASPEPPPGEPASPGHGERQP